MTNLIYQYWDGPMRSGVKASVDNMKAYAERIGAKHIFEHNPRWIKKQGMDFGKYTPHYGQFKVAFDPFFAKYDNILFVDTDVYTVNQLDVDIFEGFEADLAIAEEPKQPKMRQERIGTHISTEWDEKWNRVVKQAYGYEMPRTEEGLLKVYNSGVVLYSRKGLDKIKETFAPFKEYVNLMNSNGIPPFYGCDQPYLHCMMVSKELNWIELSTDWNEIVHYVGRGDNRPVNDDRTNNTKFVHIQLSNADDYDADTLWRITNKPQSEWKLP